ncbi:MAG TPA: sigma-70 family RNA polymerase sigma factor [Pirellulales bacterium]|nr:sigma-70 family RNA polymerase sigma factor [Pirellulales bacterium]
METDDRPDEWFMGQVAQGKRECLGPLLHRHAAGLLTFIQRMVGNHHQSEELFQEVCLAVWTHSRSYQPPRSFKSWLFGIAVKKCRAEYRKQAFWIGRAKQEPTMLTDPAATPLDAAIQGETARLVADAVAQLPLAQRTVLVLRAWNHLSYPEIAEIVGRSEVTVRSHMFHGLASLRKYLEPRMP